MVLQDGQASALVRRGKKRNHVGVTAFGPDAERLRLLEIIQGNLDGIHTDLPDPKPEELKELGLSGLPGIYHPVTNLEAAEKVYQPVAVPTPHGRTPTLVEPTQELNQMSEQQKAGCRCSCMARQIKQTTSSHQRWSVCQHPPSAPTAS